MNSYALGLTGSWLVLSLLLMAAFAGALYYYRQTNPPIMTVRRNILILLRTIALWLLLFALFEPVLTLVRSSNDNPKAIVLLDDSRSMTIPDKTGDRREQMKNVLSANDYFKGIEKHFAAFAEKTFLQKSEEIDSMKFGGELTDISKALRWSADRTREENIQAIVMMSDGNFTAGNNPLYDAERLALPLYIIGIGDTSEPRDIAIQPIIMNEYGYIGKSVPVSIMVKSVGYTTSADIVLSDNGKEISRQTIQFNNTQQNYSAQFTYTPTEKGTHKLTASVAEQEGEMTLKNNSAHEFITIEEFKRKTVIFAGAPNPDLSFIRRILEKEEGAEIITYIQKQGAEFYDKQPDITTLANAQAIVFIGFPIQSTSVQTLNAIEKELEKGKPLLFIAGLNTDYSRLKQFDKYLPFTTLSSKQQEFSVTADIKTSAMASSIFQLQGAENQEMWNRLPPLFRTETFVKAKPEANILAGAKMNSTVLNEPLIISRTLQNSKSLAIMGYGLYRWKLLGQAADVSKGKTDVPDLLEAFVNNTMQWLTIDNDKKRVSIKPVKRRYAVGERIEFTAQVYDPALSPLDNANVEVTVQTSKGQKKAIFQSLGNGRYAASMEALRANDYSYKGTATINNEPYGADEGRFSVGDNPAEFQTLTMNKRLLRELAERTGGKYYSVEQAKDIEADIKKHARFMPNTVTKTDEITLWNALWLLGISLFCFSLEWFIRTRARLV